MVTGEIQFSGMRSRSVAPINGKEKLHNLFHFGSQLLYSLFQ